MNGNANDNDSSDYDHNVNKRQNNLSSFKRHAA